MEKKYREQVMYPDGHVEVLEESFENGKDALAAGDSMLAQLAETEQFNHLEAVNEEDNEPFGEPFYYIIEDENGKAEIVFDSRNRG